MLPDALTATTLADLIADALEARGAGLDVTTPDQVDDDTAGLTITDHVAGEAWDLLITPARRCDRCGGNHNTAAHPCRDRFAIADLERARAARAARHARPTA